MKALLTYMICVIAKNSEFFQDKFYLFLNICMTNICRPLNMRTFNLPVIQHIHALVWSFAMETASIEAWFIHAK